VSNLFKWRPDWLHRLLGLEEPELPVHLSTAAVVPTADIVQGGHPRQELVITSVTVGPAGLAGSIIITSAGEITQSVTTWEDAEEWQALVWLECNHVGGAAALNNELTLQPRATVVTGPRVGILSTGVGQTSYHEDWNFGGGIRPIWIPPNHALVWSYPATAAGETQTFRISMLRFPAGVMLHF
jgi:hypothetical protein